MTTIKSSLICWTLADHYLPQVKYIVQKIILVISSNGNALHERIHGFSLWSRMWNHSASEFIPDSLQKLANFEYLSKMSKRQELCSFPKQTGQSRSGLLSLSVKLFDPFIKQWKYMQWCMPNMWHISWHMSKHERLSRTLFCWLETRKHSISSVVKWKTNETNFYVKEPSKHKTINLNVIIHKFRFLPLCHYSVVTAKLWSVQVNWNISELQTCRWTNQSTVSTCPLTY